MQKTIIRSQWLWLFGAVALVLMVSQTSASDNLKFNAIQVTVNDIELKVEYADTFELRSRGLMFRKTLCQSCGMLFKFEQERQAGMWMKNTLIPLDVAFIRKDGVISDIKPMTPLDLTSVTSSGAVLYALEMNQGWFKQHKVKVGDKVLIH